MAIFKKKQQDQEEVPAEIQEYYQAERRERVGVAWLLAFVTLVVTVLLAVGLFFGGRWVYRQIFNDNGSTSQPGQTTENEEKSEQATGSEEQPESEQVAPETSPAGGSEAPVPENGGQTGRNPAAEQQRSATPSTPSNNQPIASAPSASNTPRTGPLPSTGPGDVVAIFVLTTAAAGTIHYAITAKSKTL